VSDTDTRAIKLLAEERSRLQLAVRAVRAEILHIAHREIRRGRPSGTAGQSRKAIIADAAAQYDVSIRTIEITVSTATK
jgi:hypothetical protein